MVSRRYNFLLSLTLIRVFFFFQAEDGIRDLTVTGVQTCALPISDPGEILERVVGRGLHHRRDHEARRDHHHGVAVRRGLRDRKSTRLNSSHSQISYAVLCLKQQTAPTVVSPRAPPRPPHPVLSHP